MRVPYSKIKQLTFWQKLYKWCHFGKSCTIYLPRMMVSFCNNATNCILTPREEAVNDTGHYSCIYSYFFTGLYNRTLNITLPPAQHCCHIITNHDEILNFGLFMVQSGLFGPRSEDTNHLIHQCFNENQTGWDHWNGLFHTICYWISHLMGQTAQGWLFRS